MYKRKRTFSKNRSQSRRSFRNGRPKSNFHTPGQHPAQHPVHRPAQRPVQRKVRMAHSTMNVHQLVNKIHDNVTAQPSEHVLQHQFNDFKIDPRLQLMIANKGYVTPTPIQDRTIPVGLEGKDVIGIANTGTGKTAAFLIPLINKMLFHPSEQALILAPTRELALQIEEEFRSFSRGLGLTSALCIGGTAYHHQRQLFKSHVHFVIGTPGRIMDLLGRKFFSLHGFRNIVLDEADRMVDMGFIKDIRLILGQLPEKRQSFFFTATLESHVEALVRQFMRDPVRVSVSVRQIPAHIEQDIVHVSSDNASKQNKLIEMLQRPGFEKVLVFCRTKHGADKVVKALHGRGITSHALHGNKSQNHRIKVLEHFKKGKIKALVATDVAARGLDIGGVSHVINFDIPANYDDYIHRIGRTGRADAAGKAFTFVAQ